MLKLWRTLWVVIASSLLRMLLRSVPVLALVLTVRLSLLDTVPLRPLLLPATISLLVLVTLLGPTFLTLLRLVLLFLPRPALIVRILFGLCLVVLLVLMVLPGIAGSTHPQKHAQNCRAGHSYDFRFHLYHLLAAGDAPLH